jgi:protein-S-isoprenylcysteine O-methyltransferase Ste14
MNGSFWWIILAMGVYGIVHSLLAGRPAKALARRWFGPSFDRWYRLFYNLVAGITFLPVVACIKLLPDRLLYRIPVPWMLITMAAQAIAILVMLTAVHDTGLLPFVGLAPEEEKVPPHLVTESVYHYLRHPLYGCGLVVIWLFPVMTTNFIAFTIATTAYIAIGIHIEERKLRRQFGAAYEAYRRQTPMLIPGLYNLFPRTPAHAKSQVYSDELRKKNPINK